MNTPNVLKTELIEHIKICLFKTSYITERVDKDYPIKVYAGLV